MKRDKAGQIRTGQTLDVSSLETYLRSKMELPNSNFEVLQFPAGYSNLTYLLRWDNQEFVLRRPPHGAKIKSGHDMGREFKILSGLQPIYPKIPRTYLFCDDLSVIDAPFYIMERLQGVIFRGHTPKEQLPAPAQMQMLSNEFVTTFAEIHALDYHSVGLENLGRPDGYVKRQVEGWTKRYINAKTADIETIEKVYTWLNKNIPKKNHTAFIHNDFKYDNIIFSQDDKLNIKGVLDWEMATIGDPLMDLGTTLGYWIQESDPDFMKKSNMNISIEKGNLSRSELVHKYAQITNLPMDNITFYYVFGLFKITVIIQQIFYRYKNGFTTDARFKNLDQAVINYGKMGLQALQKNKIENLF
ncbi:phosphotransferase family protein [Flavobacteriaceae bacterium]|jgi:aminoglycoside phosphotransferase (APT) family kinase protein|nr:phosphotransferase family protein [Flavobacteriaceae bacterium]MDO7570674.1 phosphotransferase family protein [Flavobacteriaceae bacterium]